MKRFVGFLLLALSCCVPAKILDLVIERSSIPISQSDFAPILLGALVGVYLICGRPLPGPFRWFEPKQKNRSPV